MIILEHDQRYAVCPSCGFKKAIRYMHIFCFDCEMQKYHDAGYTIVVDENGVEARKNEWSYRIG
jgi:hypothetical protein